MTETSPANVTASTASVFVTKTTGLERGELERPDRRERGGAAASRTITGCDLMPRRQDPDGGEGPGGVGRNGPRSLAGDRAGCVSMDEKQLHPSRLGRKVEKTVGDDVIVASVKFGYGRADCCSAAPAYRAVLPVNAQRPRPAELLFCGHHLHMAQAGLHKSGATVYDAAGSLVTSSR
jgi:hypothetical protein